MTLGETRNRNPYKYVDVSGGTTVQFSNIAFIQKDVEYEIGASKTQ